MKTPKNKNSIRAIVGFTQEELAMLLGVTRSALAKFELGLGSLPDPAKHLLAELLNHMKDSEAKNKPILDEERHPLITEKQLKRLLLENNYQLLLVTQKINAMQKKLSNLVKAQKLLHYLHNRPQEKSKSHQNVLEFITRKTNKMLARNNSNTLYQLVLQQQLLTYEKQLLEEAEKKLSLG
ncbi:helix-turn-helix transcriptional regulator [Flavobacterium sedimenticola]|uniref:Helix-turn-helix transcriptional regulator n=1 Tax=Flavobacterium sedimenticola TaxID=3043286 RepID=A0ABT6XPS0_9FLAO|nr:helix-turn-helix transcriptional regulator [Flavobacterium sedimenticola]MDI9257084.1 helix-turn-helix transcriptional regulator [Flavobacterium sedimenticola]